MTVQFVSASISPGFYGLVGAVGGALLAGIYGQVRDWLRSKKEFKAAATLLAREIRESKEISTDVLEKGRWPIGRSPIWTQSWGDYRASIVNWISAQDYDDVAAAYAHLDQLEHSIKSGEDNRELAEPGDREFLLRGTQEPVEAGVGEGAAQPQRAIPVSGAGPKALVTDRAITVLKAHIA
jgi:hypothetical protein